MKPVARIEVNGADVTTKYGSVLESITITDEAGVRADRCEIAIDAREGLSAPPIGTEFRLFLGYAPEPIFMGAFRVRRWSKSGPVRRLVIEADAAALSTKIRAKKTRSHHAQTVKQIVEKIAGQHGLTAVVDQNIGARLIPHIDQQTESDVAFLTRLAQRNGAIFKLGDGMVLFAAKGSKTAPDGSAKVIKTLLPKMVSTWDAAYDHRGDFKSASAEYMDHAAGKRVRYKAGEGEPHNRIRALYGSEAEAKAAAEATLGDFARGMVTVTLDGPGNPDLFAEALLTLKDFDPDVDGDYLAKSVRHEFSGGGYTTSATLEILDA